MLSMKEVPSNTVGLLSRRSEYGQHKHSIPPWAILATLTTFHTHYSIDLPMAMSSDHLLLGKAQWEFSPASLIVALRCDVVAMCFVHQLSAHGTIIDLRWTSSSSLASANTSSVAVLFPILGPEQEAQHQRNTKPDINTKQAAPNDWTCGSLIRETSKECEVQSLRAASCCHFAIYSVTI